MPYKDNLDPRARASRMRWYQKNKKRQHANQRVKREAFIPYVNATKDKPCTDCGNKFPPECMDFDHVRGEKKFNVSLKGEWTSKKRIDEEIAKCELVCANCHRIRTTKRSRARSAGHREVSKTTRVGFDS